MDLKSCPDCGIVVDFDVMHNALTAEEENQKLKANRETIKYL